MKHPRTALLYPITNPIKRSLNAKLAMRYVVGVRRHRNGFNQIVTRRRALPQTVSVAKVKSIMVKGRRNESLKLAPDIVRKLSQIERH